MPEALYAPLPLAFEWVYEFPSPMGGVHRKLTPARWNGSASKAQYLVYTADQMRAYADATCSLRGGQQGWRPIEDGPTNVMVLALYKGSRYVIAMKRAADDFPAGWTHAEAFGNEYPNRGLTHWMPLPSPPTSTHPQETQP